jgi:glutathione peroxidase
MRIHNYTFQSVNGHALPLDRWTGQPFLVVNTASECGYTPQYRKLQRLFEEFSRRSPVATNKSRSSAAANMELHFL